MTKREPIEESEISESRRENMRRIKNKNTGPELKLRSALHRAGYRFRLHERTLPGSPDVVFPSRKKVIFVNGCFWHGHDCPLFKKPKTRTNFWLQKIARTKQRDAEAEEGLRQLGWQPLVIWQCELTDLPQCLQRIGAWLK